MVAEDADSLFPDEDGWIDHKAKMLHGIYQLYPDQYGKGVAEDGLAIQNLATLNVDELYPLSPEASAPAHPGNLLGLTVVHTLCPGD